MIMEGAREIVVFPFRCQEILSLTLVTSIRGTRLGKFLNEVSGASLSSGKATRLEALPTMSGAPGGWHNGSCDSDRLLF